MHAYINKFTSKCHRLPYSTSMDGHCQETYLAPSADNQTSNYVRFIYIYISTFDITKSLIETFFQGLNCMSKLF